MDALHKQKHAIAEKINKNHGLRPWTTADQKLSIKHLKDSVKYNERHMVDHRKAIAVDKKIIKKQEKWGTPEGLKRLEQSPK